MEIRVKGIIVFKADGLDLDGVTKELQKDCKILEITDSTLTYESNSEEIEEAIKMIYFDASFAELVRIKLKWNTFTTPLYGQYVLFPQ